MSSVHIRAAGRDDARDLAFLIKLAGENLRCSNTAKSQAKAKIRSVSVPFELQGRKGISISGFLYEYFKEEQGKAGNLVCEMYDEDV